MRVLSTSDLHYANNLDEDIERSMAHVTSIAKDGRVDLIAIPGDLFHKESNPRSRNTLKSRLIELAEIARVVIVKGNHDVDGDLNIYGDLASKHIITVYDTPQVEMGAEVQLFVMPWLNKAEWVGLHPGWSKYDSDKEVSRLAVARLKAQAAGIPCGDDTKRILVSHLTVFGGKAENNQPLIGSGITVDINDLVDAGFYGGIFGHLHKKQSFANGRFFYNGSPCAMDYGESPDKYCSIMDTKSNDVEWYKLNTVDRYSIDGQYEQGKFSPFDEIDSKRAVGARIRVRYKISEEENGILARERIEKLVYSLKPLEVKLDPQVQPKSRVRAAAVSSASGAKEKLAAYWESAGECHPDQEEIEEKLSQLEDECALQEQRSEA